MTCMCANVIHNSRWKRLQPANVGGTRFRRTYLSLDTTCRYLNNALASTAKANGPRRMGFSTLKRTMMICRLLWAEIAIIQ